MNNTEFLDDLITVTASIDHQGKISPKDLLWRHKLYTIINVGRQWQADDGRYVLVEVANGDRFEIQLSQTDLLWHLRRVWREEGLA